MPTENPTGSFSYSFKMCDFPVSVSVLHFSYLLVAPCLVTHDERHIFLQFWTTVCACYTCKRDTC